VPYTAAVGLVMCYGIGANDAANSWAGRCRLTPCRPLLDRAWFQRSKLEYDKPLSNFGFNFNLRRYSWATSVGSGAITLTQAVILGGLMEWAGAVGLGYGVAKTIKVGRCIRLTPDGGQGERLVLPDKRESKRLSLTGGRAKALCLLIYAEASLSLPLSLSLSLG